MSGISQPRFGIFSKYELGAKGWGDEVNSNFCKIDQLLHISVDGIGELPASATPGTQWIDENNNLNSWTTGWQVCPPRHGMLAWNKSSQCLFIYDGTNWTDFSTFVQNKIVISSKMILDAIQEDPCAIYKFQSGADAPSGSPASPSFPFYVQTSTTKPTVWAYDCGTSVWHMLTLQSSTTSQGASSQGNAPLANANGFIDLSFIDLQNLASTLGSVLGGSTAQANVLPVGNAQGFIDLTWLNPIQLQSIITPIVASLTSQAIDQIPPLDSVNQSTGVSDANKIIRTNSNGLLDKSLNSGLAQFATDIEASSAGFNVLGCQYFNTTDQTVRTWLVQPDGAGDLTPRFAVNRIRRCEYFAISNGSTSVPNGQLTNIAMDTVVVDNCLGSEAAGYRIKTDGLFSVKFIGAVNPDTANDYVVESRILLSQGQNLEFFGTTMTGNNPFGLPVSSLCSFDLNLTAGTLVTPRLLQVNSSSVARPILGGFRTYMTIAQMG